MQHQVLARKWRPRTFQQMIGQEHVLKALMNALNQNRLHHAYLFTGTRGVGKTTIARILAKCLNCDEGVSAEPCNRCSSCMEINEGRCVDLIEVDAASRTKVEDTRELLDNVQYAPTKCRYKIYLIDEVHMLSTHSFNALLKTLEEPPEHIKFLLATTDPQKLPVTVLSRCLQFNLKNLAPDFIVGHLRQVLEAEQVGCDEAALWLLAQSADGSMRDALSLTDQAIAYGQGQVREADVGAMLGTIDRGRVLNLLQALLAGDGEQVLHQVAEIAQYAPDYSSVLNALISLLHRIAVAQAVPQMVQDTFGDAATVKALAQDMAAEELQLYYQIALLGSKDLPLNADMRAGLEMILLRMLAFKPDAQGAHPPEPSLKKKEPNITATAPTAERPTRKHPSAALQQLREEVSGKPRASQPEPTKINPPQTATLLRTSSQETTLNPAPASTDVTEVAPQKAERTATLAAVVPIRPSAPAVAERELKDQDAWIQCALRLPVKGMTKNILLQTSLIQYAQSDLQLALDPQFFGLVNEVHQQRIEEALLSYFGQTVKLQVVARTSELETPMAYQERMKSERLAEAKEALEQDPVVQDLMQRFGARLEEGTITPNESQ